MCFNGAEMKGSGETVLARFAGGSSEAPGLSEARSWFSRNYARHKKGREIATME